MCCICLLPSGIYRMSTANLVKGFVCFLFVCFFWFFFHRVCSELIGALLGVDCYFLVGGFNLHPVFNATFVWIYANVCVCVCACVYGIVYRKLDIVWLMLTIYFYRVMPQ